MDFTIKLSNNSKVEGNEDLLKSLVVVKDVKPSKIEEVVNTDSSNGPRVKKATKSMTAKVFTTQTCKYCFSDNRIENGKQPTCSTCGNDF